MGKVVVKVLADLDECVDVRHLRLSQPSDAHFLGTILSGHQPAQPHGYDDDDDCPLILRQKSSML